MDIQTVTTFMMWCTILNFIFLCFSFLICVFAADLIYRIHSRWFPIQRETFNTLLYSFLGVFKLLFFFFNVIPYVVLLIIGQA